ncbi:hypothetical protein [Neobacillus sp. LXY-1]|uniref:hypothetical protein n=1 Tax=Neobacillus sp. LXY-1 TaxID=3379133 RepID=UPI003EE386A2
MSLANDFDMYTDEIELIQTQNRVECDLYSIIACIIRERKQSNKISLRDVSARRKSEFSTSFIGNSGFPDFVIRERIKSNNAATLGAIEVKRVGQDLDKHLEQVKGHLISYKRVIYTNGLEWRYYKGSIDSRRWKVELGKKSSDGKITWDNDNNWKKLLEELDKIEWIE